MPSIPPCVLGLGDVLQQMQSLRKSKMQSIARRSLLKGAAVIRDAARQKVRKRSGALAKSLVARTTRKGKTRDEVRAYVSVDRRSFVRGAKGGAKGKKKGEVASSGDINPRNYGHLVEFGSKPHTIRAKKGKAVMTPEGPRAQVQHPGTAPHPFMRPAYDEKSGEAVAVVGATARQLIEKEVGKGK